MPKWSGETGGELPGEIVEELLSLKHDFREALSRSSKGLISDDADLKALDRRLGMILIREARKPVSERGIRMVTLALGIYQFFPELKFWKERQLRIAESKAVERLLHSSPKLRDRSIMRSRQTAM